MNFILWIVFGALAGWIASALMVQNKQMGAIANIVVGIIGAFIGSWVMSIFGATGVTGFNLSTLLVAIGSAVVLLWVVGLVRPKIKKYPADSAVEKQSSLFPKIQEETEKKSPRAASAGKAVPLKNHQEIETQNPPAPLSPNTESGIIFISYRRTDSADVAGRIYDRLVGGFGYASVFKDVDSIPLGFDFKEYLDEKVSVCNVLLAIIGDGWLEAMGSGRRSRLEDKNDFVRIEIESALARGIPVIPLLVRGASMPSEDELPASLKKLVYRNGIRIRPDPDFHRDMDRLISALNRYVKPEG